MLTPEILRNQKRLLKKLNIEDLKNLNKKLTVIKTKRHKNNW